MPAHERAAIWLKKEGYPLEMFVAEAVRKAGMSGIHGVHFQDRDRDEIVHREIDVWGLSTDAAYPIPPAKDWHPIHWHWTIECKRNEWAWILLTRPRQAIKPYPLEWFLPANGIGSRFLLDLDVHDKVEGLSLAALPEYVGTRLVNERDPAKKSRDDDPGYHACHKVVRALFDRMLWSDPGNHTPPILTVGLATIVVEGDLFEARMSDGELTLVPTNRGAIVWTHPETRSDPVVIPVVTKTGFLDYVEEVSRNRQHLVELLRWRLSQNEKLGKLTDPLAVLGG